MTTVINSITPINKAMW